MKRLRNVRIPSALRRGGTTLTEVLMAILIMGIGVVLIATLFPSSVLQSIKATQLTNATLLRYNAEGAVDTVPDQLVHDPDRDNNFIEHHGANYVVDPLGFHAVPSGIQGQFGNGGASSLQRFAGGATNITDGENLVSLPDSWKEELSGILSTYTATSVTLAPEVDTSDLSQLTTAAGVPEVLTRIVLFDASGRVSHVPLIDSISGSTVNLKTNLPTGFVPVEARIEVRELNYSWLLTVRNRGTGFGSGANLNRNANVDVVVFFRRTFVLEEERVRPITLIAGPSNVRYNVPIGAGNRPILKKGGFLCDVDNGRWYRIFQLDNENSNSPIISIDREPPAGEIPQNVIFMPGVIEVYPLEVKDKGE